MRTDRILKWSVVYLTIIFLTSTSSGICGTDDLPELVDITEKAGIKFIHSIGDSKLSNIVESAGVGVAMFDYDGDNDLDIYFVNGCYDSEINHPKGRVSAGKFRNALYRNNGNGTFTDVTDLAGVGDTGYGMASLSADYDNDGDADLLVTNYGPNTFTGIMETVHLQI